jgi:hypothetical protein
MPSPDDNPIADRLDRLHDQWTLCARDPGARLLRWVLDEDEIALVEGFVIRESDADASQTPDIFWISETPFRDPSRHGIDLREGLRATYDEQRAALADAGVAPLWTCPPIVPQSSDVEVWLETLATFRVAHPGTEILAVWLRPSTIANPTAYVAWLQRLVQAAPVRLRFLVTDSSVAPVLDALRAAEPVRVRTQRAGLDVAGALEELSSAAGSLDTPGGQYRHLYVQMSGAVKTNEMARIERLGAKALAIAEAQKWFPLACAIHFLHASALMRTGQHRAAFDHYMQADNAGARAEGEGDALGKKLRVQARLSAGAVLLGAQDFAGAATVFAEAVPFTQAAQDRRAELDCLRLASYSYAQLGDSGRTWEAGRAAIDVGRAMDEETRKTSTLKNLGQSLLHWAGAEKRSDVESEVQRELDALLGQGWAT